MIRIGAACLPLLLGGCVISPLVVQSPPPPEKAPPPHVAPDPVWANSCAADWYATAKLPPCAEEWINELVAQQKKIEARQGHRGKENTHRKADDK